LHSQHKITKEDYVKYVRIAQNLGTRFLTGFVLGEFDRENTCGKPEYNRPLAPIDITEQGLGWHNSVPDASVMDFVKENGAYIDFGLHGVRHGHYTDGENLPGEWARRPRTDDDDNPLPGEPEETLPWDKENITGRTVADCYKEILRQYFTEEEFPFPESFIPPSHILYVNPDSPYSTCAILTEYGVKYATLRYTSRNEIMPCFTKFGLFDHGGFMTDRRPPKEVSFDKDSCRPPLPPRAYPFIETHFNNLWGVEDYWEKYLSLVNLFPCRMLAKNTENVFSNHIYRKYLKIKTDKGRLHISTENIPKEFYDRNIVSNLVLKVFAGPFHIASPQMCAYYKDRYGWAYLTFADIKNPMGRLFGEYDFEYKLTLCPPDLMPDNKKDTYCVYGREERENSLTLRLKAYRNQNVKIRSLKEPKKCSSSSPKAEIKG
ncbi:MAG: hypothetical protein KBT47_04300, partial [Armatimonadetes bacterium]|nr:hypothetical protein [Candidatus Hippobium faecium]